MYITFRNKTSSTYKIKLPSYCYCMPMDKKPLMLLTIEYI